MNNKPEKPLLSYLCEAKKREGGLQENKEYKVPDSAITPKNIRDLQKQGFKIL